jgi:hypothetical protein
MNELDELYYLCMIHCKGMGKRPCYYKHWEVLKVEVVRDLRRFIKKLYQKELQGFYTLKTMKDSVNKLVYVDYFYGNDEELIRIKKKYARFTVERRNKIIDSKRNKLIKYIPENRLILVKSLDGYREEKIYF